MTLEELHSRLRNWHFIKHGRHTVDLVRTALKTSEEVGEIAKAVLKADTENAAEEVADVFLCLLHLCRGLGIDIVEQAEKKLKVIERRIGIT